jgi:tetraacyldisaccharide 4'-kinase
MSSTSGDSEQYIRGVMSGDDRRLGAGLLRSALALIEPAYRGATWLRNRLFDRDVLLHARRLPRPVISVGNLTTGGTGKTPAVVWLARALRERRGWKIAVLLRGYRAATGEPSDEEELLRGALPEATVAAGSNRYAGGSRLLARDASIDAFVLDDGFQHRRLHRDVDVVLIDATNPFGYGRVLPRGMLRESTAGLTRASAVLLTRCDQSPREATDAIESAVRSRSPTLPVFRSSHRLGPVALGDRTEPIDWLRGRRVLAFAGIGNPTAFARSLEDADATVVSSMWFGDHHAYAQPDVEAIAKRAREQGVDAVVTTHKDRVKLDRLVDAAGDIGSAAPLAYVGVSLAFEADHEAGLLAQIDGRLNDSSVHPARRIEST